MDSAGLLTILHALERLEAGSGAAERLNAFRAEAVLMGQVRQQVLGPDQMQEFERRAGSAAHRESGNGLPMLETGILSSGRRRTR